MAPRKIFPNNNAEEKRKTQKEIEHPRMFYERKNRKIHIIAKTINDTPKSWLMRTKISNISLEPEKKSHIKTINPKIPIKISPV